MMSPTQLIAVLLALCGSGSAFDLGNITEIDTVLEILIPTVKSSNAQCRAHSRFYMDELKRLKLWATEMFDASSKFPSGVLFGSAYDFGNFDECVEVSVPHGDGKIAGKYCMAKFRVMPPESVQKDQNSFDRKFYYQFYENENFINTSTWEKVLAYQNDRSKRSRNDFHFSYCIPSSCQSEDLESTLQETIEKFNSVSDFKISVSVDGRNCQMKNNRFFTTADYVFLAVVAAFIFVACCATLYDCLTQNDQLSEYRMEGKTLDAVLAFSVWSNLKKLSNKTESNDGLECIHGMKVISMFLIIMGHRIMFFIGSPILNSNFVESLYSRVEATVLLNGPIIVDTFFNISGFLACYLLLIEYDIRKRGVNFFFLYLHRIIRLTPAYAIVLAFYCTIFVKMGSGPFWDERVGVEQERCVASWWANLLYLNNYINTDKICMFQSWYMTCDMHLFIVTPLFVWLLKKKPKIGIAALVGVVIISICLVFTVVFVNNEEGILLLYMKMLRDPVVNNTFKNTYIPTHMRASPYFVGMLTGFIKYKMRTTSTKMPRYMVYMGWLMCVFVLEATVYFAFIFYIPEKPYDPLISAMYASLHHFTWSLCISWMIIAVSEGNGSWIRPLLAWRPLILLSRITYTAFLCHGAIQLYTAAMLRHSIYSSIFNLVLQTAGDITMAYVVGLFISMYFEAPIIQLEKIIFRRRRVVSERENKIPPIIIPKIKIISQHF